MTKRRKAEVERQPRKGEAAKRRKKAEKAGAARLKGMNRNLDILRRELRTEELVSMYQERWAEVNNDT